MPHYSVVKELRVPEAFPPSTSSSYPHRLSPSLQEPWQVFPERTLGLMLTSGLSAKLSLPFSAEPSSFSDVRRCLTRSLIIKHLWPAHGTRAFSGEFLRPSCG